VYRFPSEEQVISGEAETAIVVRQRQTRSKIFFMNE